jgi:hypothetical protein
VWVLDGVQKWGLLVYTKYDTLDALLYTSHHSHNISQIQVTQARNTKISMGIKSAAQACRQGSSYLAFIPFRKISLSNAKPRR